MNVEEALVNLDTILKQQGLTDIQEVVFRKAWEGQSYPEIAESAGYEANYIKNVGSKLWKLLSKALSEQVTKSNFRSVLRRHNARLHQKRLAQDIIAADSVSQREDWGEAVDVPVFYALRNAPPVGQILVSPIRFLSNQQETEADLPKDIRKTLTYYDFLILSKLRI